MSEGDKGPFEAQVAAVVLVLFLCALFFPMPGGGLLITRLSGTEFVPEPVPVPAPRGAAVEPVEVPVAAAPAIEPTVEYVDPSVRFNNNLPIFSPEHHPLTMLDPPEDIPPWMEAQVEGKTVWLDNRSYMAWGPKLDIELSGMTNYDLELAKSACQKQTPLGSWALPTAAEFDMAKVNGILRETTGARHRWLTWQEVSPGIIIPSVRGYARASADEGYSVRCIGRTLGAPMDGYLSADNATTLRAIAE